MLETVNARDEGAAIENNPEVKTEVVAAYHELLHKLKQNKKPSLAVAPLVEGEAPVIHELVLEEERVEAEDRVAETLVKETPGDYQRHISKVRQSILEALEGINLQYIAEHNKLRELSDALEIKKRRIAEVYDIEVNIDTLAALVAAQKEKTRLFEQEIQDRRQQLDHEIAQKRREIQQEEQKYIYQRDLAREKDNNRYEMSRRDLEQELAEIRNKTFKELEERQARVGSAEELADKVAQFPEELRLAAQKAKDAVTKQLTIQFEYESQLLQKEVQLRDQKIATLEAKISNLESSIARFESLKNSFNHLLFEKTDA